MSASGQFDVRMAHAEDGRVEAGLFDIQPEHAQAAEVVRLFREFMGGVGAEFQAPLPFLKRQDFSLEWNASDGGVAFAVFSDKAGPASLGMLLSRRDPQADRGMSAGFDDAVLSSVFPNWEPEERQRLLTLEGDRPLLLCVLLPERAESNPLLQLLNTSLAAVFFGALAQAPGNAS